MVNTEYMENRFNSKELITNPFQDPCGNDAHRGLERFLDKFHQPTVPNYTIITDPEYFCFLWFHDSNGNLISCPYFDNGYTPILSKSAVNYANTNFPLYNQKNGISSDEESNLADKCVDLTPFVRQVTIPEIKPAGATDIQTLFGQTSAGAFSPYASDGKQQITLQVVDTEFSILDSLFYPWMKDINSPWWYRPSLAYTEWATPYPMATLEIQRPRMRYRENAKPSEDGSRSDSEYTYYSYKYIGVKPTSYNAFEVNGAGVTNLLRNLNMTCDMCIVDLTNDVAGSGSGSKNLGLRSSFIFSSPPPHSGSSEDSEENPDQDNSEELTEEQKREEERKNEIMRERERLNEEYEQQQRGDMPGEDEDETPDEDSDEFNGDEPQDKKMDSNDDTNKPNEEEQAQDTSDTPESWDDRYAGYGENEINPNSDLHDTQMNQEASQSSPQTDGNVSEQNGKLMDVGQNVANDAAQPQGYTADGQAGTDTQNSQQAVGGAIDMNQPNPQGSGAQIQQAAANEQQPASNDANQQNQQQDGGIFSKIGSALGSAVDGVTKTAFGVVSNALNGTGGENSTTLGGVFDKCVSSAFSAVGNVVGQAGNIIGGILGKSDGGSPSQAQSVQNMQQMTQAKNDVKNTSIMASALNGASNAIASTISTVGNLASKTLNFTGQAIGELGGAVQRMATSNTAKATPIETYSTMVTKNDSTNFGRVA